ncbi:AEC family transporter [Saccharopolyspora taberi]|uniref:AEC family transporter n=1 Tax=Saccharopolyspora taberi TaxID=60895 RepID=A0ABN3VDC0_9PSEU
MNGVLEGFLVISVVVAVGYAAGRAGVLGPSATQVLSRAAFFIATPALLFVTLLRADIGAVISSQLVVTAVTSSLACLLYVPAGLLRRRPAAETGVGAMASGYVNAGNLGIPIATYALGDASKIAPVLLFQLAVLTPLFTTLFDLLSERARGSRPSVLRAVSAPLRNPIALATAAGLICSATGVAPPEAFLAPIELLADLAVPAMLLAFGISLHGAPRPGRSDAGVPALTAIVLIKNFAQPLLGLLIGVLLQLRGEALLAVVVCAALPTAQNVFGYAVRFQQGTTLAREAVLTTTLVSMPVMFGIVALLG